MRRYYLQPTPGTVKSFYNKAEVEINDDGSAILYSYKTPILKETPAGLFRIWNGWSATTGRHIKAFCGINKAEFDKLPTL